MRSAGNRHTGAMTETLERPASRIAVAGAALIVVQLVVRAVLAARGDFYWDDLILTARASSNPILSWEHLGHRHDGHFMPGALLLVGVTARVAPLEWWLPAVTLVVLQAVASVAVWRMIRVIAPQARVGAIAALAFYLFSPMTVSAFLWWAAGINTLPLQAAMAVVVANAVLLTRAPVDPPRARWLTVGALLAFAVGLAFFEKSLVIFPVAFAAAALTAYATDGDGLRAAVRRTAARGRALWYGLGGLFVVWLALFAVGVEAPAGDASLGQAVRLVWRTVYDAVVPATVGAPWAWDRWTTSPPFGEPGPAMIAGGGLLIAGAAVWSWRTRAAAPAIWGAVILYVVAAAAPVAWYRSGESTAPELMQTMRYLPDTALVITIGIALTAAAPVRRRSTHARRAGDDGAPRTALGALVGILVFSCLISTALYSAAWRDDPTGAYLDAAKRSLAANRDLVMFDQSLPLEVLTPVAYPDNQISRVFGQVAQRPEFGDQTDRLRVLDEHGAMVPGGVSPQRGIAGIRGSCGRPALTERTVLPLSGPLIEWDWTVVLHYCASHDGELTVSLGQGERQIRVHAGLNDVYFQLRGSGEHLVVEPSTPGLAVHISGGRVGEPIVAAYAP